MLNIPIILLVSAEFCFYLLIAQTGIVEYFHSNVFTIAFLPMGAVVGTVGSLFVDFRYKFHLLVATQMMLMLFYPNLNPLMLFALGMSLGAISVMVIEILKQASSDDIMVTLILSYTIGTLLFNSDIEGRWIMGLGLSLIVFLSAFFITIEVSKVGPKEIASKKVYTLLNSSQLPHPIWMMFLWVFLDSTLFESLSRSSEISIWRDGFSLEIVVFHTVGVVSAIKLSLDANRQQWIILASFILSFILYVTQGPLLLSIIYPFVISFYNVVILQTLIRENSFIRLSLYMILIGWGASGLGLLFALHHAIVPIFVLCIAIILYRLKDKIKLRSGYGVA